MKPTSWYFVQDHDGLILAAFPERDLAESYMDDMPWEIEERIMSTDSTFVSATLYDETLRRAEKAEAENRALTAANESLKQSHLCDLDRRVNIGRSLREREADLTALRARLESCEAELKRQLRLWHSTFALGLDERDFAIACIERALANKHTIDDATHSEREKANQTHCFKDNGDFAYRVKGEPK